jgi:dephospho-CoA kinase
MLYLKRVAITGSLASGKTTVCQFFEEWGAYVVHADRLLHRVFTANTPIGRRIVGLFGSRILDGTVINRSRVAEIVVAEPKLLTELEGICHPYVNEEIQRHFSRACRQGICCLFVAEIPLLFESPFPLWQWFDVIVTVVAERIQAKERYARAGGTSEQFDFRESRQMSPLLKMQRANYTITNSGCIEELRSEARTIFESITLGGFCKSRLGL